MNSVEANRNSEGSEFSTGTAWKKLSVYDQVSTQIKQNNMK